MLIQLIVRNVYSFRDETVFSLASGEGAQPEQVVGIYGANAAGKSNLVKALQMLRAIVVHGSLPRDMGIPAFALDPSTATDASRLEVVVSLENSQYEYAIRTNQGTIEHESLFLNGELVFERSGRVVRFGRVWNEDPQYLQFIARGTSVTRTILAEAATRSVTGATKLYAWFEVGLQIVTTHRLPVDVARLHSDQPFRAFVEDKLAGFGTGVHGVELASASSSGLTRGIYEGLGVDLSELGIALVAAPGGEERELSIRLRHSGREDRAVLPFASESDGTRQLMGLLPVLESPKNPRTIIIDELDRSLHAALTRRFVDDFREMNERTGRKSQLIFTSHDTSLLTGALKRPEELWFAEKDGTGASTLYSLADFKAEQIAALSNDLAQGYLSGRFGAVPFPIPTGVPGWMRGTGS